MPSTLQQFNRRLPPATVEAIKRLAKELGVSDSAAIKVAVTAYLRGLGVKKP